jgi:hypothetical protein
MGAAAFAWLRKCVMVSARDGEGGSAVVAFKPAAGGEERAVFADTTVNALLDVLPWRTFRWFKGQKHYSGAYWSATERRHVMYESRHEHSFLLLADFAPSVERIAAQPFQLAFPTRPKTIRHTPDFLVGTDRGAVVVDVTWPDKLDQPEVAVALELTKQVVEARGWEYAIITGYPRTVLGNIRFLAGFRR